MPNNNCCPTSIYNKQTSVIPSPLCASDCPEDVTCPLGIIPATCISILNNYCIDIGETMEDALVNITNYLCNIVPPSGYAGRVMIDVNDTCSGYLADKITSDYLNITTESVSGCKTLKIDCKQLVWVTISMPSWSVRPGFQPPQYAIDCNGKVWFRGSCYKINITLDPSAPLTGCFNTAMQTDDISPSLIRTISSLYYWKGVSLSSYDTACTMPMNMDFNASGTTSIYMGYDCFGDAIIGGTIFACFDGYSYEI